MCLPFIDGVIIEQVFYEIMSVDLKCKYHVLHLN